MREIAASLIIWAYDDVLFDSGWLRAHERAFRERPAAKIRPSARLPGFYR
jgi:hypothetical protein